MEQAAIGNLVGETMGEGVFHVGEKTELYVGDSRDIVVTQKKMREERINIRYNLDKQPKIVLYDMDEIITAKLENFKDSEAVLTMIEQIPGEWEMIECNLNYEKENANILKFEITLPARTEKGPSVVNLNMHYHRKNLRK